MRTKIGIVGSRTYSKAITVSMIVEELPKSSIVVTGGAGGVDTWAEESARAQRLSRFIITPEYHVYSGHDAPLERNTEIAELVDFLIAFTDSSDGGTWDTIRKTLACSKPVVLVTSETPFSHIKAQVREALEKVKDP